MGILSYLTVVNQRRSVDIFILNGNKMFEMGPKYNRDENTIWYLLN